MYTSIQSHRFINITQLCAKNKIKRDRKYFKTMTSIYSYAYPICEWIESIQKIYINGTINLPFAHTHTHTHKSKLLN